MNDTELALISQSADETEAIGRALATLVPRGAVVALRGDLAAGKTCLVRGMAAVVSGSDAIHSPTFTLVNEYGTDPALYHLDLYRLTGPGEVADLGYEELFESDGVCVIEWAERAEGLLPARRLDVFLEHGGGDTRKLRFLDRGVLPANWQNALRTALRG